MQQIADWLKNLGMAEYAERFAENDIDMTVLPDLTDQHLKDLGISLGHRLKMLRAIRDLGNTSVAATTPSAPVAAEPTRRDDAERRQLTIMFCDLVGSTALSARLDPEDLRGIIGGYHGCCTELIERNDGFVAKYMGDGVLAYFGYPQAHEHDAERAIRAGLALVEAVPKLVNAAGTPLQARVGIATGLAVVGDLIGAGAAREQAVVGETPNLAARLQTLAKPGAVVIAEGTRRLVGNLFELNDLGSLELRGLAAPVRAFTVVRPSSIESRFEALHASELTTLVGREEETDLLLRRWQRAKCGEGQVVLLCGEPGIGKSRVVIALLDRIASEPHTRLRYFCSPHHSESALYPIVQRMERAAGFEIGDDVQETDVIAFPRGCLDIDQCRLRPKRSDISAYNYRCLITKVRIMRTIAIFILAITAAAFASNPTVAKVKRIEFIPESIRGSWAPSAEVCEKAATSMITVSATTYTSSGANCKIMWISETSAARGPMYSAHLQCAKPEEKAPKTQSDVIFYPKDDKQISIGPRFSDLKDYQRCSASESAITR